MNFSEKIKAIRIQCLLSQEEFAEVLGVSYSTVNRWEREKTRPNYRALKLIDRYCKIHNIEFDFSEQAMEEHKI